MLNTSNETQTKKQLLVRKRDGRRVRFDRSLIVAAVQKAFCAEYQVIDASELDSSLLAKIETMVDENRGRFQEAWDAFFGG